MELILSVASIALSLASMALILFRRRESRQGELQLIARQAVAAARSKAQDGLPLQRLALETALLLDLRDGKQDFSREQLWAAISAEVGK
jgi:hypothetical protein